MLWAYQFSTNMGGGATGSTTLTGHRLGLTTLPSYHAMGKYFTIASDMGGYGWGRVYPNTYLLSLFDQEKDSRYTELICTELICNNRADASYGKPYDLELSKGKADYITNLHFSPRNISIVGAMPTSPTCARVSRICPSIGWAKRR